MPAVELTAGTIDYQDTGGDGPVLVLLGGVLMDGSVWDPVVADLRADHRCVVPTLPLGAHRQPMRPGADLSLRGFGQMVAELLEHLDLRDVTLVQNDHGAALALAGDNPERVARLVISSCEAFENYPPGLPGKNLRLTAMIPGGIPLAAQALRQEMLEVCERLASFDRPALVVWTPEDRVQRPEHGQRFAALLADAPLVEIPDSYTLIMLHQPAAFASAIREFVRDTPPARLTPPDDARGSHSGTNQG